MLNESSYPLQEKSTTPSVLSSQPTFDPFFVSVQPTPPILHHQTFHFTNVPIVPCFTRSDMSLSSHSSLLIFPSPFRSVSQVPDVSSSLALPSQHSSLPSSSLHLISPSPLPLHEFASPSPPCNTRPMLTRAKVGIYKPNLRQLVVSFSTTDILPKSSYYEEARGILEWEVSVRIEYEALLRNYTRTLVPLSLGKNTIGSKWMYKVKLLPDHTLNKYKSRAVTERYHQKQGIDYTKTFSHVMKPQIIRVVLTLAISYDWDISQIDVNNVFVNGELKEDVYMDQSLDFVDTSQPNLICKLNKALYGLNRLLKLGFTSCLQLWLNWVFKAPTDNSMFLSYTPQ